MRVASFGLSHISFTLTTVTISILLCSGIGPYSVSDQVHANCTCPWRFLFTLTLIVATPEILLALYTERFSLKLLSCFPILVLILFIFLDWFSARTSAKLPLIFAYFAVNFSSMLEKHVVSRFPSMSCTEWSWQDSCGWWSFDGLKPEGVFRLTSTCFSAEFLLLVLFAITLTSLET